MAKIKRMYGSIPHLIGSRRGPADKGTNPGQQRICTEKARDKFDTIIVTEKLDGSNVAVIMKDGQIIPMGRSGYPANTSNFKMHRFFYRWVMEQEDRFRKVLSEGESIHGEWLLQAHGTLYNLKHEPFVLFDHNVEGERTTWDHVCEIADKGDFVVPNLVHYGSPISTSEAMDLVQTANAHCVHETDVPEGAVWRVERKGKTDFLAKMVDTRKTDGKYLPGLTSSVIDNDLWLWHFDFMDDQSWLMEGE